MSRIEPPEVEISRRDLFDRVWTKPMTTIAAELNTSTALLSALARRLALPLPRAGHWMKKEVGKQPPTPDYPADPKLDDQLHSIMAPARRRPSSLKRAVDKTVPSSAQDMMQGKPEIARKQVDIAAPPGSDLAASEHKRVAKTRSALRKSRSTDRVSIGGPGKFRLLVATSSADRACSILDLLVNAAETRNWPLEDGEHGYAIAAVGEPIGFIIEEKMDRKPHLITPAEVKEKAEYDRKCALADRGIGYRPWRGPEIPEYDHFPNGDLVLKFDHDYAAGGLRRTYSDGKRQRLEDLIPVMIDTLEQWAAAIKARREEQARWKRDWEEQERRRQDRERQARIESYRIAFLQRQIERKREIDGLSALIATWEGAQASDAKFAKLLEFAHLYRQWLEDKIAPSAIAERIAALKLMDEDVYIYDAKRID